jgi:hypothetical protein
MAHGRNGVKSFGGCPPLSAHACKYACIHNRGLICQQSTSVMNTVNIIAANSPAHFVTESLRKNQNESKQPTL